MRRIPLRTLGSAVLLLPLLAGAPAVQAGPVWCEALTGGGDAGSDPGSAQVTGGGTVERIEGRLEGTPLGFAGVGMGDFEDVFAVCIYAPHEFTATTFAGQTGFANFDTQLWVFKPIDPKLPFQAVGVTGNDNFVGDPANNSSFLTLVPDDGSPVPELEPGLYYLAITGFDNDPVSPGGPIFDQMNPGGEFEISGPDGPGGMEPIIGWVPGQGDFGDYEIVLTGTAAASICLCPGDTNGDGIVNGQDLVNVLLAWGSDGVNVPGPGEFCDVNLDGVVNGADLVEVILRWGPCFDGST